MPRRTPARRTIQPAPAAGQSAAAQPVEIRLVGYQPAVERLVAAIQADAGPHAGPVSWRPSRYGDGVRAYLTIAVPAKEERLK
ncbi:hypothetical protein [Streptomyces sp. cg36]|uniref:hypothetical protein n=1 Tax=Streptomyces sp. cg36 TaxID=3238798 RepID=UPI0034E2BAD7